ncbi:Holliday junction branch migration protein RuvA [Patescibacteria group bacterium]|nr:Holliday junction branch migration protein RuvA [Patescibacteria group bacterium]
MIAYLKGKIILKKERYIIIDIGQIGYQVMLTEKTISQLNENQEIELYTYLYHREDSQELYGFLNLPELELFKNLINISGVGPKSALAALAVASVEDIIQSVLSGDPLLLQKVAGIGKKTAERIILELKSKIEALSTQISTSEIKAAPRDLEIIEALGNLGYSHKEIIAVIRQIPTEITDVSERIKETLKLLGK